MLFYTRNMVLTLGSTHPEALITCVVEATGCFHYPVTEATQAVSAVCRVLNPIVTKQYIKTTIRGKKTDRSDALLTARAGWSGHGRRYVPEPYLLVKHQARSCQKLASLASSFALYHSHRSTLLEDDLSTSSREALEGIQHAINQAKKQLLKDLETQARDDVFRLLQTIPGVGPYIGASLVGEIQDISRLKSSGALTAFAGLDPKIRQSGHALNSTGKLTKRGSSYLCRNILIAASVTRLRDPQFKAFYDKKRSEGKSYTVATCAVARKLLSVVRSVWLSGVQYYVPDDAICSNPT